MKKANEWRGKLITLSEHAKSIPKGGMASNTLSRTKTGIKGIKPLKDKPHFGNFSAVLPAIIRKGNTRKAVKRVTISNGRLF